MKAWIIKNQLLSFFALTFLISWVLGIPYFLGIGGTVVEMAFWIGGSGPGLAFVFLSWFSSSETDDLFRKKRRGVFWITWGITTITEVSGFDAMFFYITSSSWRPSVGKYKN